MPTPRWRHLPLAARVTSPVAISGAANKVVVCVPDVVVGASFRLTGLHRLRLLRPVQRLDLRLLVHAEHDRVLRRARYSPTTSMTFGTSSGSVENLNLSTHHGWTW